MNKNAISRDNWTPDYSPWRHGGWYVRNVRHASGAVGCVSRNYTDKKWRIVCDDRPNAHELYTYKSRDDASYAEYQLAEAFKQTAEGQSVMAAEKARNDAAIRHNATKRLEYLRGTLRAETISYGELTELERLAEHIDPSDVELLEAAGVPEFGESV